MNVIAAHGLRIALLSSENIEAMREATGAFAGRPAVELKTIYQFGGLEFVV